MTRNTITTAIAALVLSVSGAAACTAEDVQERQGALVEAVQALMATDPEKAQEIVATMQAELDAASAAGDEAAVCELMDRLTAEAQS